MGIGVATLFVGAEGLASLSGWMPNGQSFATFSRVVDDGAGHWVMPVYVASAGVLTGELEIAQDAPASGSEVGGTLAWLKPGASAGAGGGFLKEIFPVGTFHSALDSKLSTGLGGGAFTLTLKAGAGALSGDAVQNGTWPSSGKPVWAASTLSGLSLGFTAPNGQFSGAFSVGKKGTYKGLLLSRDVQLKDGTVVRGGGFYVRGTGTGAVLITSSAPAAERPGSSSGVGLGMVSVLGGTLPGGSVLAGQVVGDFSIGKTEVTWGEWKTVREWAVGHGYSDLANVGAGSGDNFPVTDVSWYDAVKWCNAKSVKEGKVPVYLVNGATYKSGQREPTVKTSANGYRLPTDAEWEWAARGGRQTHGYTYSGSNDLNEVAWWHGNSGDVMHPVGDKISNELGVHDMNGNAFEWCWDFFRSDTWGPQRRARGGCYGSDSQYFPVSYRLEYDIYPDQRYAVYGFRLACNLDMVRVLGGTLPSGSAFARQVVGDFQIGKTEVTWGEWKLVREWAVTHGYSDLANVGAGSGDNFPVTDVSWYDVVKWCNAKSDKEGKVPLYLANGATYKSGEFGWNGSEVVSQKAGANGYRLPTELEWEWAARGGRQTHSYAYSGSDELNVVAWYYNNSGKATHEVGTKAANEQGLYDMSGNVCEWCWDSYGGYAARRFRGGSWYFYAGFATVSYRGFNYPGDRFNYFGFRLACSSGL